MTTTVPTAPAPTTTGASLLRTALLLDAVVTGVNGAAYAVAAPALAGVLGLPPDVLRGTGVFLLCYALAVWAAASRPRIGRRAVLAVVAVNVLWAADSLVVAATGWGSPTPAGTAWICAQAAVVAGFAAVQLTALRRRGR